MRLLFDQNLSFRLCNLLSDLFPGSEHVGQIGLSQADDLSVWRHGHAGGFLIVSQDSDFAELALLRKPPPKVLWLRCGNRPTAYIVDLLRQRGQAIFAFVETILRSVWRFTDRLSSGTRRGACPCGSGKKYKHCHGAFE